MSNAADLAATIDAYQSEFDLIDRVINAGNTSTPLLDLRNQLQNTIDSLILLYIPKATEEINDVIGNEEFNGNGLTFERLRAIYTSAKQLETSNYQLLGLVNQTVFYPELDEAVKQRIVSEVQAIFDTYNDALEVTSFVYNSDNISGYTALQLYYEGIPFPYDRVGVAIRASSASRANFEGTEFAYGPGNQVSFSPKGVGSNLSYSTLNHIGASSQQGVLQSTGSAYFMSECIFFGSKYPQNVSLSERNTNFCDDPNPTDDESPLDTFFSWLTVHCSGSHLDTTYAWRDHIKLLLYFGYDALTSGVVLPFVPDMRDIMRFDYLATGQPPFGGEWRDSSGPTTIYNKFREAGFAKLETGDYVFHKLGNNSGHGFMIVGWGNAVNVAEGLNAQYSGSTNLQLERPRDPVTHIPLDAIPYVADFSYGYRALDPDGLDPESDKTGWLQDPRHAHFMRVLLN